MSMQDYRIEELYDLTKTIAAPLFARAQYPWELLPLIGDYIVELDATVPAQIKDKYRLNPQVLRIGIFHWKPGQDDEVFKPRDEKIFGEESFQDQYDNENYRGRGTRR